MTRNSDHISLEVWGGLGNQIFGYFAGLYLADTLGVQLELIINKNSKGARIHRSTIERFSLNGKVVKSNSLDLPINKFIRRLQFGVSRNFSRLPLCILRNLRYFASDGIGFDGRVKELNKGVTLQGYFQTYKYFDLLKSRNPVLAKLELKSESSWYKELSANICGSEFVVIHIRRGDYLSHSGDVGVLSVDYYRLAIEKLKSLGVKARYVVFSDDIQWAKSNLNSILPSSTFWVSPPSSGNDEESFKLMTLGSYFVIANSTYSYWAANLSESNRMTIAPAKWFKGEDDPDELKPKHWIEQFSVWEE
jgi:hypothetical protein